MFGRNKHSKTKHRTKHGTRHGTKHGTKHRPKYRTKHRTKYRTIHKPHEMHKNKNKTEQTDENRISYVLVNNRERGQLITNLIPLNIINYSFYRWLSTPVDNYIKNYKGAPPPYCNEIEDIEAYNLFYNDNGNDIDFNSKIYTNSKNRKLMEYILDLKENDPMKLEKDPKLLAYSEYIETYHYKNTVKHAFIEPITNHFHASYLLKGLIDCANSYNMTHKYLNVEKGTVENVKLIDKNMKGRFYYFCFKNSTHSTNKNSTHSTNL